MTEKPRRHPRGTEPAEAFTTRLNVEEEVPLLKAHAKLFNITTSAALRDLARRGMKLPSHFES
jgi:hypothetical protein